MRQVFHLLGVKKLQTSPYLERLNRTLKEILTAYVNKDHSDWDVHLPLALFVYRNIIHSSSGVSPFRAVYSREANTPLLLMGTQVENKLEKTLNNVQGVLVKENINEVQRKQKKGYDDHKGTHVLYRSKRDIERSSTTPQSKNV